MIQFEGPRVMHSLVPFPFEVCCGVPFSLHAGKGKCCMWVWTNRKSTLQKKVLMIRNGPIWMPQGRTPLGVIHFWGPLCMREKGNAASDLWKGENLSMENRLAGLQMVQFECPMVTHHIFKSLILPGLLVLGLGRTFLATGNGRQKARLLRPHTTAKTRSTNTEENVQVFRH